MGESVHSSAHEATRYNGSFHHFRYVVLVAGGMAMGMMLFLRLSISVAIVSMVNHTQLYINLHPNLTENQLAQYIEQNHQIETGEFDWSNEVQEKIVTFYMITYTIFQISVSKLILKNGIRLGVPVCLSICALTNILTPMVAYWHWYWVFALRLINGCAASGIASSMISLIEFWTPSNESAMGIVLYQFVSNVLSVIAPALGGLLASIHWKWAYYVPGVVGLIFCILWYILIADGPESSWIISQKELDLIREVSTISHVNANKSEGKDDSKKVSLDIPFYFVFKFKETYSLVIIWCIYCATSGGFLFLLPAYIHRVLRVPIHEVGALTTIAQIGSLFSMLWPNRMADFLTNCGLKLSLTSARRVIVFISLFIANVSLLLLAYSHSHLMILVCIFRFLHMTQDTIVLATIISQFGPHGLSGFVYSVVNSLGCVNTTVFCVLVGKFLDYTGETLECWSWIFVTIITMNTIHIILYGAFCHSNPVDIKALKSGEEPKN